MFKLIEKNARRIIFLGMSILLFIHLNEPGWILRISNILFLLCTIGLLISILIQRNEKNKNILVVFDSVIVGILFVVFMMKDQIFRHKDLADKYLRQGNYTQAISEYTKVIEMNPKLAMIYYNRGVANDNQGNSSQALSDFSKAIELKPDYAYAYDKRGDVFRSKGNYDQAISDFTKAIVLSPNELDFNETVYDSRGLVYSEQGKFTQAINDINKCIEMEIKIHIHDPFSYYGRGNIYVKQGNIKQAILDFTKAIEIDPKFAWFYYVRAKAYFDEKEYDKAWVDVHKAEELVYKPTKEDLNFIADLQKVSGKDK